MKKLITLLLLSFTFTFTFSQTWSACGSGVNNTVQGLSSGILNSTNFLFAGGSFTTAGGNAANRIATWNGTQWDSLGAGISTNSVYCAAMYNGELYVGGTFTTPSRIAKWNGSQWVAVGTGCSSTVYAMLVWNGKLYFAGNFTTVNGQPSNHIAAWDGNTFTVGFGGGTNGIIQCLAAYNGELYAGGSFTTAGGNPANRIAKWNNIAWAALGQGCGSTVNDMKVYNNELWIGGAFTTAGGQPANYIAKWDGATLGPTLSGVGSTINALELFNGDLVAGGLFTTAGGNPANRIARWNGVNWSAFGSGLSSTCDALRTYNGQLYAGGAFTTAGGNNASRVARWSDPLSVQANQANVSCNGNCDGTATANAVGQPPFSYSWSNGQTIASITGLCPGTYTITVTDNTTNTVSASVTITQPPVLSSAITNMVPATCGTCCDGSATGAGSGGTTGYTYLWNPGGQTTATATNLCPGTYTFCVTDANGCTSCSIVTITFNTGTGNASADDPVTIFPNPASTTLSVIVEENSEVKFFDLAGKETGTWKMKKGANKIDISSFAKGVYLYRIVSSSGKVHAGRLSVIN